jgi:hypothetical protein
LQWITFLEVIESNCNWARFQLHVIECTYI